MKIFILVILIAFSSVSFANMASPYREGTKVASAFTSNDIDILKEKISVSLNKGNFLKVEIRRFELLTPSLRTKCSTS